MAVEMGHDKVLLVPAQLAVKTGAVAVDHLLAKAVVGVAKTPSHNEAWIAAFKALHGQTQTVWKAAADRYTSPLRSIRRKSSAENSTYASQRYSLEICYVHVMYM